MVRTQRVPRAACAAVLAAALLSAVPAAGAQGAPAGDELALLAHDVDSVRAQLTSGVRLNGYFAFEYHVNDRSATPSSFRQHSFDLFIGRNWDHWRVLSEFEYEDGPEFHANNGQVDKAKGAIDMEFAWFEFHANDALMVRGGKFMLPQYWNVNHYPPVVLSTSRPFVVATVFPKDTVGLMARGRVFSATHGFTYVVYYANGQSADANDDNENKAVGGKITAHLADMVRALSRLDLSADVHSERSPAFGGAFDAVGGEMQLAFRTVEVLAEYATREANPAAEGFYVQPSMRVVNGVRVFYRYDYLDDDTDAATRHVVGVNWRPLSDVSLKLEASRCTFDDPATEDIGEVAASAALFF